MLNLGHLTPDIVKLFAGNQGKEIIFRDHLDSCGPFEQEQKPHHPVQL